MKTLHSPVNLGKIATAVLAGLLLVGCEANGGGGGGGLIGGEPGSFFPNDGTTPTTVTEDTDGSGTGEIPGEVIAGNFICTAGVGEAATTEIAANGLVGGPLSALLELLGGSTVTALTNSVVDKDLAIDRNLATYSIFTLTLSGLAFLDSVDQVIHLNGAPQGEYVVFGVAFPIATLELSLLKDLYVKTYLGDDLQEELVVDVTSLDLLGNVGAIGPRKLFVGFKRTKPYDRIHIALNTSLLSADVGEAMHVHELCTEGRFVTP